MDLALNLLGEVGAGPRFSLRQHLHQIIKVALSGRRQITFAKHVYGEVLLG